MKLPGWLMKSKPKRLKVSPKRGKVNVNVKTKRPPSEFWVGWPMDEDFNPNLLEASHREMMRKLGRV